jgi:chaperonin GroEL (HSP60 family)
MIPWCVRQVAAMKCPGFGVYRQDYYTDISIATGATFIAKEVGPQG